MSKGVGLLGLGKMGMPMARHLLAAGYDVYGYDVRSEVVDAAIGHGIRMAECPADVARNAAATFVVVGFDEEVEAACLGPRGLIEGAPPGAVVFLCSTIAPDTSQKIGDRMSKGGVHVLDATLCRAEHAAVDGTLLVLGGGDERVFAEWDAALHAFASDVCHLGELGAGQIGKMLNNLLLWINVSGNQEALRLGERLGIQQEKLIPALMLGSGANWALGTWHKSRPMPWAEKDLSICLDYADRVGLPVPLSGVTREVMKQLKQDKAAVSDTGTQASMQETVRAWENGSSGVTTR